MLWLHPGISHDLFRKGVMSAGANVLWSRRYPGRGLTDWLAALPPPPGAVGDICTDEILIGADGWGR